MEQYYSINSQSINSQKKNLPTCNNDGSKAYTAERSDHEEKVKVLCLAKEMGTIKCQNHHKKSISPVIQRLKLLSFRKTKFSTSLKLV